MAAFINGCISVGISILSTILTYRTHDLLTNYTATRDGIYRERRTDFGQKHSAYYDNKEHSLELTTFIEFLIIGCILLCGPFLITTTNKPQYNVMARGISLSGLFVIITNVGKFHHLLSEYAQLIAIGIALIALCGFSIYYPMAKGNNN